MAKKTMYAKIADQYVKVDGNTSIPRSIAKSFRNHASLQHDAANREMIATLYVNGIDYTNLESNRSLYKIMIEDLRKNKVTEIKTISDKYVLWVDYSIYNEKGTEINHSCTTKSLDCGYDGILPLGCAFNNELVYRRVKLFDPKIVFAVTNKIPFGVMASAYNEEYTLKINDICILQCTDPTNSDCYGIHNSIEGNSYSYDSHTIQCMLQYNIPVYSTAAEKLDFGEFQVSFYPRKLTLDLHLILGNMIVAYDEQNVLDVLLENINGKYDDTENPDDPNPDPAPGGDDDDPSIPSEDDKPDSDGKYDADSNGFYYYYERCIQTNPNALLVVEDAIPDNKYDKNTMIRHNKVVLDIPDISVGDYVRYVTGFDTTKL